MDEEERKQIMERRNANRKLCEIIEQGTRYHEPLKIRFTDGQEHEVEVYPFSGSEFRRILEAYGVQLTDLGDRQKLTENMKFIEEVARLATGQENIAEDVLGDGCAQIMMKCFELSGLRPAKDKNVESFQQGDIQP